MDKEKLINIAIQILPEAEGKLKYRIVDEAIEVIKNSGFLYKVCPFETVVECTLPDALELVRKIHFTCREAGTEKMITNLKIQSDFNSDVFISDKMEKYE